MAFHVGHDVPCRIWHFIQFPAHYRISGSIGSCPAVPESGFGFGDDTGTINQEQVTPIKADNTCIRSIPFSSDTGGRTDNHFLTGPGIRQRRYEPQDIRKVNLENSANTF